MLLVTGKGRVPTRSWQARPASAPLPDAENVQKNVQHRLYRGLVGYRTQTGRWNSRSGGRVATKEALLPGRSAQRGNRGGKQRHRLGGDTASTGRSSPNARSVGHGG